jgi:hypothetical protein
MLRLHLTRDSVAAGDDLHAPHTKHVQVQDGATAVEIAAAVIQQGYLPKIEGGAATWVASSREPFAVYAQEWPAPKAIGLPRGADWLSTDGRELRIHFSYVAQIDPTLVLDVLTRCTFAAANV